MNRQDLLDKLEETFNTIPDGSTPYNICDILLKCIEDLADLED